MTDSAPMPQTTQFTVQKSRGLAVLLAFLFGPLGLLYVSVPVGIIMTIIALILGAVTLGLAAFVIWPICIIWALIAPGAVKGTIKTAA